MDTSEKNDLSRDCCSYSCCFNGCLDNDEAGRIATKAIQNSLSVSYKVIDDPPKNGKDVNKSLCNYLGINTQKEYESVR